MSEPTPTPVRRPAPPPRTLRDRPDLDQLKRQAKELLEDIRAGKPEAIAEATHHDRATDFANFALHDAQRILARAYGFDSWPKLKAYVDGVTITRFCDAAQAGDLDTVRAMLRQRPELVHMDRAGNNEHRAIHHAVLNRDATMTRLLMEADSDARKGIYPHRDATSAWQIARDRGYGDIVSIIEEEEQHRREAMSCPNATVSPAQDQLNDAIRKGANASAIAMLEADAPLIRSCDREGRTPLHVACEALNEPMVAWLLEHRADVKRRDTGDRTPLDAAVGQGWGKPGDIEQFRAVAAMLRRRGAELTPRSAVALGEADWLRARHAESTLVNPIEPSGGLLSIAVKHDQPEMLLLLLNMGMDPNERVRVGGLEQVAYSSGMPLWHAAGRGKYAMAELLLDRGADPNANVHASGWPLSQAYGARDERMKALLRARGAKPNPSMVALFRDTAAARELLDDPDPDVARRDTYAGDTVAEQLLWGSACGGDPEIVRMALERVGWPRNDSRWFHILQQPLRIWNHGPGHWVDKTGKGMDRSTYPVCFRLVLDRCDPDIVGRFGMTILHDLAAAGTTWGHEVMTAAERVMFATMLLDAGARLDVRDNLLKSTPLGWASRWGRVELVKLLLARSADPVEPDAEPWATPLAWAEKMGHNAITAMLWTHHRKLQM